MNIKIDEKKLQGMVDEQILTTEQSQKVWTYLTKDQELLVNLNTTHFFYFFGGLICMLAMAWFLKVGWEQFGGPGLTLIAVIYMVLFTLAAGKLWSQKDFQIPGGLLYTIAVCVTPLLVYGLQRWTGFWVADSDPILFQDFHVWIKGSSILMSIITVVVGGLYLRKIPFGFLTLPIAVALFYIAMDIVPLIHADAALHTQARADLRKLYAMAFGVLMFLVSYFIDKKQKVEDYSAWLYLVGVIAFWGGLSLLESSTELGKFGYLLINIGLLFLSLFLHRIVFMVFGAMGAMIYLIHLADKVFRDSLLFPFVLTFFGLALMYAGVKYQKNRDRVDVWFARVLPRTLAKLRPIRRE